MDGWMDGWLAGLGWWVGGSEKCQAVALADRSLSFWAYIPPTSPTWCARGYLLVPWVDCQGLISRGHTFSRLGALVFAAANGSAQSRHHDFSADESAGLNRPWPQPRPKVQSNCEPST